jgi:predicted amidohydrolase
MTPLRLAVVQFTPAFGEKDKNLARIESLVQGIAADVIVLPELCTTGYFFASRQETRDLAEPANGRTVSFFRQLAKEKNAVLVAGFAEHDGPSNYISCVIAVPEIPNDFIYRKTHLFYKEKECFDPGDTGFFVVEDAMRNVRIGPMICYDWRFPESARILTLLGADLIVCPANLVTEAWKVVMPARAVENKVYVAVANRAGTERRGDEALVFKGHSVIYDCLGNEMVRAGLAGDEILQTDIYPRKTRDKSFNPINDVLQDRRPQCYKELVNPKGRREEK